MPSNRPTTLAAQVILGMSIRTRRLSSDNVEVTQGISQSDTTNKRGARHAPIEPVSIDHVILQDTKERATATEAPAVHLEHMDLHHTIRVTPPGRTNYEKASRCAKRLLVDYKRLQERRERLHKLREEWSYAGSVLESQKVHISESIDALCELMLHDKRYEHGPAQLAHQRQHLENLVKCRRQLQQDQAVYREYSCKAESLRQSVKRAEIRIESNEDKLYHLVACIVDHMDEVKEGTYSEPSDISTSVSLTSEAAAARAIPQEVDLYHDKLGDVLLLEESLTDLEHEHRQALTQRELLLDQGTPVEDSDAQCMDAKFLADKEQLLSRLDCAKTDLQQARQTCLDMDLDINPQSYLTGAAGSSRTSSSNASQRACLAIRGASIREPEGHSRSDPFINITIERSPSHDSMSGGSHRYGVRPLRVEHWLAHLQSDSEGAHGDHSSFVPSTRSSNIYSVSDTRQDTQESTEELPTKDSTDHANKTTTPSASDCSAETGKPDSTRAFATRDHLKIGLGGVASDAASICPKMLWAVSPREDDPAQRPSLQQRIARQDHVSTDTIEGALDVQLRR